jgi:sporulation protein YlmC with PRC-barrel domain
MDTIAGWVAPVATMIAAMMTAANLGARVTGWGFVVFVIGSIAWTIVGLSSGQINLIAANAFLTLVNIVGVWRWLGREAKYQDSAETIAAASEKQSAPTLVAATTLVGKTVIGRSGQTLATVVDALFARDDARLRGLLVRYGGVGGVGERVVLLSDYRLTPDGVEAPIDAEALADLPEPELAAQTLS